MMRLDRATGGQVAIEEFQQGTVSGTHVLEL